MRTKIMITTLLAASLMLNCNPKEILEPTIDFPAFVVIDGDTIKTRDDKNIQKQIGDKKHTIFGTQYPVMGDTIVTYKDIKLKKASKIAKLDNLKNNEEPLLKGKPLKMVVIGGAIASGFRDGGWFNEGMITSYPNIIANQMGIAFDLPLFDPNDYNGSERKVYTKYNPTGGPVPKIKNVINNSGINNPNDKKPLKPFIKNTDSYVSPLGSNNERIGLEEPGRFKSKENKLYTDLKKGKKYDFFIFDVESFIGGGGPSTRIGITFPLTNRSLVNLKERDWVKFKEDGFNTDEEDYSINRPLPHQKDNLVRRLSNLKLTKGIFVNQPDLYKYGGYFNKKYNDELTKTFSIYQLAALYFKDGPYLTPNLHYNLPSNGIERNVYGSAALDSIIGKNVNINIKPGITRKNPISTDIIIGDNADKSNFVKEYNNSLKVYSDYLNSPIFDMNDLYRKIWEGNYTTDDGVKVNGKWPEGNFYSVDGLFPSAFGQAVIANEIIKFINGHYKSDIPLVNTKDFLNL